MRRNFGCRFGAGKNRSGREFVTNLYWVYLSRTEVNSGTRDIVARAAAGDRGYSGLRRARHATCAQNRGDGRIRTRRRDHYVALGCYFSGDCAGSCALWVYRNCLGCGGSCEISVFLVPGYLPGALHRRNERGEEVLELLNETGQKQGTQT